MDIDDMHRPSCRRPKAPVCGPPGRREDIRGPGGPGSHHNVRLARRRRYSAAPAATIRSRCGAPGASAWLNDPANKAEAILILADATRTSPESSTYAYDQTIVQTNGFPSDACVRQTGFEVLLKIMSAQGQLTTLTPADAGKVLDRQWCVH